jgi:putative Ca2+/H+ antiporter (TMEM165/GDT1 family)
LQVWTLWAAGFLFLAFGVRMLQEGLQMQGGNSHIQEEMREVEEELEEDSSTHDPQNARGRSIPLEALEEGKNDSDFSNMSSSPARVSSLSGGPIRSSSPRASRKASISFPLTQRKDKAHWAIRIKETVRGSIQVMTSPVFAQAFILTFLGEWGDRSQITTIAMAGAHVSVA